MKKLLDVYCGTGLCAIGYHMAGFEVTGIDIAPKPRYPFQFIRRDALEALDDLNFVAQFDAIHASPPCQGYSPSTAKFRKMGKTYPDLIDATRERLNRTGKPWVMENVPAAPLRKDLLLRGDMFGLHVLKQRCFEFGGGVFLMQPGLPQKVGSVRGGDYVSIFGKAGYRKYQKLPRDWRPNFCQGSVLKTWHFAMGIPDEFGPFKDVEISEGIPPPYTAYIGEYLMNHLR